MRRVLTGPRRVIIRHFNSYTRTVLTDSPYFFGHFNNIRKMFKDVDQKHRVDGVIGKGIGVDIHIVNDINLPRLCFINSDKTFDSMPATPEV